MSIIIDPDYRRLFQFEESLHKIEDTLVEMERNLKLMTGSIQKMKQLDPSKDQIFHVQMKMLQVAEAVERTTASYVSLYKQHQKMQRQIESKLRHAS